MSTEQISATVPRRRAPGAATAAGRSAAADAVPILLFGVFAASILTSYQLGDGLQTAFLVGMLVDHADHPAAPVAARRRRPVGVPRDPDGPVGHAERLPPPDRCRHQPVAAAVRDHPQLRVRDDPGPRPVPLHPPRRRDRQGSPRPQAPPALRAAVRRDPDGLRSSDSRAVQAESHQRPRLLPQPRDAVPVPPDRPLGEPHDGGRPLPPSPRPPRRPDGRVRLLRVGHTGLLAGHAPRDPVGEEGHHGRPVDWAALQLLLLRAVRRRADEAHGVVLRRSGELRHLPLHRLPRSVVPEAPPPRRAVHRRQRHRGQQGRHARLPGLLRLLDEARAPPADPLPRPRGRRRRRHRIPRLQLRQLDRQHRGPHRRLHGRVHGAASAPARQRPRQRRRARQPLRRRGGQRDPRERSRSGHRPARRRRPGRVRRLLRPAAPGRQQAHRPPPEAPRPGRRGRLRPQHDVQRGRSQPELGSAVLPRDRPRPRQGRRRRRRRRRQRQPLSASALPFRVLH